MSVCERARFSAAALKVFGKTISDGHSFVARGGEKRKDDEMRKGISKRKIYLHSAHE